MRVVFATHAYTPAIGGAERYAQGLAESMAAMGHDIYILTPNAHTAEVFYAFEPRSRLPEIETISGVTINRIKIHQTRRWKRWPRQQGPIPEEGTRRAWEKYADNIDTALSKMRPEAVVTLPHAFPNVEAVFSSRTNAKKVYAPLLHENDPNWDIERISTYVRRSDLVVALTPWERSRLIDTYGARTATTVLAPPGVDAPNLDSVVPWESETPYVVSVGRRTRSKELSQIARAVAELRAQGTSLKLIVVGPAGDPSVDEELRCRSDAVEILGEVDESTKWRIIRGAIATVSMSDRESFGIAAAESWCMHRPVISRRTPVTAELIDDGRTGFLVDDSADLENAFRRLLQDLRASDTLGNAGSARAKEFSWDVSARALLEALHTDPA